MQYKLTVNSIKFQELVSKANKGCSNDKLRPITGLMYVGLKNGVLNLKTTDGTNFLTIIENDINGEDTEFVTTNELFTKLVSKITSEKITFTLDDQAKTLSVKGNGNYTVALPLDEEGELIKWPEKDRMIGSSQSYTTKPASFRKALSVNKSSLGKTLEMPSLTQYFVDKGKVISCDSLVVCESKENLLENPILLNNPLVELVAIMPDEDVTVEVTDSAVRFKGKTMEIVGKTLYNVEDYPIGSLNNYFDFVMPYSCKINRVSLISVLDRLNLFIESNDENAIMIDFSEKGLILKSKRGSAVEFISYEEQLTMDEGKTLNSITYSINLDKFKDQLSSQNDVYVNIGFGNKNAIRISSSSITQIISLLED